MTEPHGTAGHEPARMPPLAPLVGRRPNRGAAEAAKDVVTDVQQLLRAEIALAKAEVTDGIKSKAIGAGFFVGVAIVAWLFIQAFLVFLGFVFATFLPAWAAAGLVVLLLLIVMGVLGFLGYRKMQAEVSLKTSTASREESQRAAQAAIDRARGNAEAGVEEAKSTVSATIEDVKTRLQERRNGGAGTTPGATSLGATTPGATSPAATTRGATTLPAAPPPAVNQPPAVTTQAEVDRT